MRLSLKLRQLFRTITPQDYLFNQRESVCAHTNRKTQLKPLPLANQGDIDLIDEVKLIGVTRKPTKKAEDDKSRMDEIQAYVSAGIDLMFLQIDPSDYVAQQRFMSHKCAMGGVQDYRLDGIDLIDPHRPITWEQTVVNLFAIDMMVHNTLPSKTSYKHGLYAYSYRSLQSPQVRNQITPLFIDAISKHVLSGKRTEFPLIDKLLYTGLMGRHKVMLGGMPESLYKMILGKSLTIHEMRDVFRSLILKNKELTNPFTTKEAAQNFMPHIFLLPKDLYMTALLKQAFQAATQMICAVGIQHYRPIQQYWIGPPAGINYSEATRIPEGFAGQSTQDLIEKQAIMDVLLQTRTWSKPYLSNPFPYLFPDITKIPKDQLDSYKQTFLLQYRKYSEFKNRQLQSLPNQAKTPLISSKQIQQMQKLKDDFKDSPKLSHIKGKMDLKLDKGFFSNFK